MSVGTKHPVDYDALWEMVNEELRVDHSLISFTERLSVPGGWLYRTLDGRTEPRTVQMVFVPEPAK